MKAKVAKCAPKWFSCYLERIAEENIEIADMDQFYI